MPATFLTLLPAAPTATESATTFPLTANNFFNSVYIMVGNVNLTIRGTSATDLTALPVPPQALDVAFAADADTFLASLPGMITGVNVIISDLFLPCSAVTALPTIPSRGGDPVNFASRAAALVAALTLLRTQLNAFITALIAYDPAVPFGSHKAWRIYINSNNGDATYCEVAEAQLRTASGGSSITTGGTAFQGGPGTDAGSGAGAPWDGSNVTTWVRTISGGYGFYFGYMWSTAKSIIEVALTAFGPRAPVGWKLQYSDDTTTGSDGTWTDTFTAWEKSWDLTTNQNRVWPQNFAGGKYKAFRWRVTANNGDRFYIMNEAEIHSTIGGSDICTGGGDFASDNSTTGTSADQLFDNNTASGFNWDMLATPAQIPGWIAYAFPTPTAKPAEYSLTQNSSTARAWNAWKLQGSTDGSTWTDLDTRSSITWSATPQTKTFAVP